MADLWGYSGFLLKGAYFGLLFGGKRADFLFSNILTLT